MAVSTCLLGAPCFLLRISSEVFENPIFKEAVSRELTKIVSPILEEIKGQLSAMKVGVDTCNDIMLKFISLK